MVFAFLYIDITRPSPTTAEAAAMAMTKRAKIWPKPSGLPQNLLNVIRFIFAAFNINSIDIRSPIAFFRVKIPNMPIENRAALRIKKWLCGIMVRLASLAHHYPEQGNCLSVGRVEGSFLSALSYGYGSDKRSQ